MGGRGGAFGRGVPEIARGSDAVLGGTDERQDDVLGPWLDAHQAVAGRLHPWHSDDAMWGERGRYQIAVGERETVLGSAADDTLRGNDGNDSIAGGEGNDSLTGNADRDTLTGDAGDDALRGGLAGDSLVGGVGNDTQWGGADPDKLLGGDGADVLYGEGGSDWLDGGAGDDLLIGGLESDQLYGKGGDDRLYGDAGRDRVVGGEGRDTLHGGAEGDNLSGGNGDDSLGGGAGADEFAFQQGDDNDLIGDFRPDEGDLIKLVDYEFRSMQDLFACFLDVDGGTLIDLPYGDSIMVQGITASLLANEDYFSFVSLPGLTLQSASNYPSVFASYGD